MIIRIALLTLSTFSFLYAPTATKKISSPQVGKLQAEYSKAESKRKKEIITTLTEGGFGHIADTLMISTEQEQNNQLKQTIFKLEQTVSKLKQETSDLTAQLAQEKSKHENAIIAQKEKNEALNQEIRTLQESLKASGDQKDKTITTSSNELDQTKQQLAEAQRNIKDLETEKKALSEKNRDLEKRLQSDDKRITEKQQELEVCQKEKDQARLELRKLQELMGKAEIYVQDLQAKYEQLQTEYKQLHEEYEQLEEECASSTEPTLTKQQQIDELDRKINALKVQLMADAVDQRKKDYTPSDPKITFDVAEKMVQSTIKKEIDKLEKQKGALLK